MSQQCYNKGCGKTFDEAANSDTACKFHPGGPIFHEGYKGWSCCKKRVTDFTEFLAIPGCKEGRHSNVKPEVIQTPKPDPNSALKPGEVVSVQNEPIKPPVVIESSNAEIVPLALTVLPSAKQAFEKAVAAAAALASAQKDASDVPLGTICTRSACGRSFAGPESHNEECWSHPGAPVFHEGLKSWSCCNKVTTDFDAFLNQTGCERQERHLWIKDKSSLQNVTCRTDTFQTATHITLNIYVKLVDVERSSFRANPTKLRVDITFEENKHFEFNSDLEGIIDVASSKVTIAGAKVEISLRKASGQTWSGLTANANAAE